MVNDEVKAAVESGSEAQESSPIITPQMKTPLCPQCGGKKLWRDGLRKSDFGDNIQRWLCRNCSYRFSDPEDVKNSWSRLEKITPNSEESLKTQTNISNSRQICVTETKNLDTMQETKTCVGGKDQSAKGQILQFALHCKKEGLADETVRNWYGMLKKLNENVNLDDPEDLKKFLAESKYSQGSKFNIVIIYNAYLKFLGRTWKKPKYRIEEKLPEFIPTEQEIDALISGCGKKTATILQTIKETGMRIGEVLRLTWINLDTERKILTLNNPEKGGRPRTCRISSKLLGMLQALPKKNDKIFAGVRPTHSQMVFKASRQKLAAKLGNPRLAKIHFHLIRHWFGTMEYHKKPDIIHVQKLLGHRHTLATEIYINLEQAIFGEGNDSYSVKVAETIEEATKLIAVGYEYVSTMDGKQIYKKRK